MKIKLITFFLIILGSKTVFGQFELCNCNPGFQRNALNDKEFIIKNRIKELTAVEFNSYRDNSFTSLLNKYDSKGNILSSYSLVDTDIDFKSFTQTIYYHYKDEKLIQKKILYHKDSSETLVNYKYDSLKRLISVKSFNESNLINHYKYSYNKKGTKQWVYFKDSNSKRFKLINTNYFKKGKIFKIKKYQGKIRVLHLFEYDDNNRFVKKYLLFGNSDKKLDWEIVYKNNQKLKYIYHNPVRVNYDYFPNKTKDISSLTKLREMKLVAKSRIPKTIKMTKWYYYNIEGLLKESKFTRGSEVIRKTKYFYK